jgi:hypothetical protein
MFESHTKNIAGNALTIDGMYVPKVPNADLKYTENGIP